MISGLWHSISGVLMILGLVGVGFFLLRFRIFNDDAGQISRFLTGFVTKIAIPAYLIESIPKDFTPAKLINMAPLLVYPFIGMAILFGLSFIIVRVVKVDPKHIGLFQSLLFNSNTVTIGLPVNMALFGSASLPYVLVYYMANTVIFWTLGVYMIESDVKKNHAFSIKSAIKGTLTPPMVALIIAVLLVLLRIPLPAFVSTDLENLGATNVPLSLIFIGFSLAKAGKTDLLPDRENVTLALGRFVLAPLVMTLVMWPFDLPTLLKQVFIIQSAMPTMANAAVMAREYGADVRFASISVTQTTMMMILVIPILMLLIGA
jgi:predicted permease